MKIALISFVSILISMLIIDGCWLALMVKRFYVPNIGHLMGDSPKFGPAVWFYLIYACAVSIFVVMPAMQSHTSLVFVFLMGSLFGLAAYGTYDLTNQATLKNWPVLLTIVDIIWGSFLTGTVSLIAVLAAKFFSK